MKDWHILLLYPLSAKELDEAADKYCDECFAAQLRAMKELNTERKMK